jgi:uncharacterized protein
VAGLELGVKMPVGRLPEHEFAAILGRFLSPSRVIESAEFLKGRDDQLQEIRRAWYQGGRQIFIYGYRGVGKTSLGMTAAHQHQSSEAAPIRVICEKGTTFNRMMRDIFARAFPADPRVLKEKIEAGAGLKLGGLSAEIKKSVETGDAPEPKSVNEAVQLTEFLLALHSKEPVIIIDEFDQLDAQVEQSRFAAYVKELGDRNLRAKLIFCGIGEVIENFFSSHESAYRQFHTVKLDRLAWEPRYEIIMSAADALGITVDETTKVRIARVSDGFPHFVHLVCEKLFWVVYEDVATGMHVRANHFEQAVSKAVEVIEPHLQGPYEKATQNYSNDCEPVLWAVADGHELQRPSREIFTSYEQIMARWGKKPLSREQFWARMNRLKDPALGSILTGTRSAWYEFREKMMRGYARMRASHQGVELEAEHPLEQRRFHA